METLYKTENVQVFYNDADEIICMNCNGEISLKELKEGISAIQYKVDCIDHYHIVFNFRKMKDVSPKARAWFQYDFLTNIGADILGRVDKLAIIKPNVFLSNIKSYVISEIFTELFSKACSELTCRRFSTTRNANKWILEGTKPFSLSFNLFSSFF